MPSSRGAGSPSGRRSRRRGCSGRTFLCRWHGNNGGRESTVWRCGIARLFTNGAEEGTATLSNGHWSGSGGTPTAVTTHPRSGSYEYRFDPGEALLRQLYFANSDRIMYARAYLYPDSYPTTDSAIMRIVLSGGDDWVVMLSTTGTLYLALKIIGVFVQQGAAT